MSKEWPIYKSEPQREREQIEAVFGLGGGELEDTEWGGYAYNYEGVPDWSDVREEYGYAYTTVIGFNVFSPPKETLEVDGATWELVASYASSGETDCPVCGAGGFGIDHWREEFEDYHGVPPQPTDRCGLCETELKDMPGLVYIGDSYEAVYRAHESNLDYYDEGDVRDAGYRSASYWMVDESSLYGILGIEPSFEYFDSYAMPEGLPSDEASRRLFYTTLEEQLGELEGAVERVLDDVSIVAKNLIDQYIIENGKDPEDAEYDGHWYKNMADDFAQETLFGLKGGDPEYNEITLNYLPEMFEWLEIEEDPDFFSTVVEATYVAGTETWEGWVVPTVQEAWQKAKETVLEEGLHGSLFKDFIKKMAAREQDATPEQLVELAEQSHEFDDWLDGMWEEAVELVEQWLREPGARQLELPVRASFRPADYYDEPEPDRAPQDVVDAVSYVLIRKLDSYDDWFDSEIGDAYIRDFDRLQNSWIRDVADNVWGAEIRGDGDVTGIDYHNYANELARVLSAVSPEDLSRKDIYNDLKDAEDEAIQEAFSAAARGHAVRRKRRGAARVAYTTPRSARQLVQRWVAELSPGASGYANDLLYPLVAMDASLEEWITQAEIEGLFIPVEIRNLPDTVPRLQKLLNSELAATLNEEAGLKELGTFLYDEDEDTGQFALWFETDRVEDLIKELKGSVRSKAAAYYPEGIEDEVKDYMEAIVNDPATTWEELYPADLINYTAEATGLIELLNEDHPAWDWAREILQEAGAPDYLWD